MISIACTDTATPTLKRLAKQLPVATVAALNKTALDVHHAEVETLVRTFDRPTPWTLSAPTVSFATLAHPVAAVMPAADRVLQWANIIEVQSEGGKRAAKVLEQKLYALGLLPSGWEMVPGERLPRDQYGNPRADEIAAITAWLKPLTSRFGGRFRQNVAPADRRYFLIDAFTPNRLRPGIYKRGVKTIYPMFLFKGNVTYHSKLHWVEVIRNIAVAGLSAAIESELGKTWPD